LSGNRKRSQDYPSPVCVPQHADVMRRGADERRRDLARFDGSRDRASMMFHLLASRRQTMKIPSSNIVVEAAPSSPVAVIVTRPLLASSPGAVRLSRKPGDGAVVHCDDQIAAGGRASRDRDRRRGQAPASPGRDRGLLTAIQPFMQTWSIRTLSVRKRKPARRSPRPSNLIWINNADRSAI
jgi:hypothetical protein